MNAGCVAGAGGGEGTIRSERVVTHTVRSQLFTGPLRIQNTFANESFMDELCARAGATRSRSGYATCATTGSRACCVPPQGRGMAGSRRGQAPAGEGGV